MSPDVRTKRSPDEHITRRTQNEGPCSHLERNVLAFESRFKRYNIMSIRTFKCLGELLLILRSLIFHFHYRLPSNYHSSNRNAHKKVFYCCKINSFTLTTLVHPDNELKKKIIRIPVQLIFDLLVR